MSLTEIQHNKISQALALLVEVEKEMNRMGRTCNECGLHVKENWSEAQTANTLVSVSNKLARLLEPSKGNDHDHLQGVR
jgi:hypothetical protein